MAIAKYHSYYYRIRFDTNFAGNWIPFLVEAGECGVGSRPDLRLVGTTLHLERTEKVLGAHTSALQFHLPKLLPLLEGGDILEVGFDTQHKWIRLERNGKLELGLGNLLGCRVPGLQIRNDFDQTGCLSVEWEQETSLVRPGEHLCVGQYQVRLRYLSGSSLGRCYVAEGWLASLAYRVETMDCLHIDSESTQGP